MFVSSQFSILFFFQILPKNTKLTILVSYRQKTWYLRTNVAYIKNILEQGVDEMTCTLERESNRKLHNEDLHN